MPASTPAQSRVRGIFQNDPRTLLVSGCRFENPVLLPKRDQIHPKSPTRALVKFSVDVILENPAVASQRDLDYEQITRERSS